jgi:hypothetical protein
MEIMKRKDRQILENDFICMAKYIPPACSFMRTKCDIRKMFELQFRASKEVEKVLLKYITYYSQSFFCPTIKLFGMKFRFTHYSSMNDMEKHIVIRIVLENV